MSLSSDIGLERVPLSRLQADTEPPRSQAPERRLMAAVLQDAMKCIRSGGDDRAQLLCRQAMRRLLACDPDRPYSFEWICKNLELDSDAVRKRLRRRAPRGYERRVGFVQRLSA